MFSKTISSIYPCITMLLYGFDLTFSNVIKEMNTM